MNICSASFTAAQFLTAMMWGQIADSSRFGRKTVLMIGLAGTSEASGRPSPGDLANPSSSAVVCGICLFHFVCAGLVVQVVGGHHERERGRDEDHVRALI